MAKPVYAPTFFLSLAIFVSVGAHSLVLAVKMTEPLIENLMNNQDLEVFLVNARSETRPLHAKALAQADLDGGGNTDKQAVMSTPLPNIDDANRTQDLEDAQKRVVELEQKNQQMQSVLNSKFMLNVGDALSPQKAEQSPTNGDQDQDLVREQQALMAKIARQTLEYNTRPRRAFIGANAKSAPQALYVEHIRSRIDKVGTDNFPAEVRQRQLYLRVMLLIEINHDGTLVDVKVHKTSGSKILDQAALNIIRRSAPFVAFPAQLRKETDRLVLTRYLTFTRENQLENVGSSDRGD